MSVFLEVVVMCASALHLTKGGAMNKLPNHVKFAPVNLVGVIRVSFSVTLMSSNEIRHVHFQSRYAGTLGTFQGHSIRTMRSNGLEKDIPRLESFVHIGSLCFEKLHCHVRRESGIVDTGDECP